MSTAAGPDDRDLLQKLFKAIEDWENSGYYLPDAGLFDIERFLTENGAAHIRAELESIYGTPLNFNFWSSFLAYHRLQRAREEIKAQDALQEEKRKHYLEVVQEEKKAGRKWLKEWFHAHWRRQMKVIPGGRKDEADG